METETLSAARSRTLPVSLETYRGRALSLEFSSPTDADENTEVSTVQPFLSSTHLGRIFNQKEGKGDDGGTPQRSVPFPSGDREQGAEDEYFTTAHRRNAGCLYTIVAFVNSASGDGAGKVVLDRLVGLLGKEFVFDLNSSRKGNMPEDKLEPFAMDPMVRVLSCGGDGTMGWIESSIDEVWRRRLGHAVSVETTKYKDHLPLAIMPLGTGNDLSRSYGWGGSYSSYMSTARMVDKIVSAEMAALDRWRCVVVPMHKMDEDARKRIPQMLGKSTMNTEESVKKMNELFVISEAVEEAPTDSSLGPCIEVFDGVFCNYFSIGMDAQVVFEFHKWRESHPNTRNRILNKIMYIRNMPSMLLAPHLCDKMKVVLSKADGELVELKIPKTCRAIILLNIQSYGGGSKIADIGSSDDGLIEVLFVSHKKATSSALSQFLPFKKMKVAAQTSRVCIRTNQTLPCQVDGEPWQQSEGIFDINHSSRNPLLRPKKEKRLWNCKSA